MLLGRRGRGRGLGGGRGAHIAGAFPGAHDLLEERLALLDVLAQVEADVTEGDLLGDSKPLEDLKLDWTLGEVVVLVNGDADGGDELAEVVVDAVVGDGALCGAAAVLGVDGVGEMPFYVGAAGDEGDVVEVMDLSAKATSDELM
jgi:hypothetical protein